jgi:predicted membrane protein
MIKIYPKKNMLIGFTITFFLDLCLLVVFTMDHSKAIRMRGLELFFAFLFIIIILTTLELYKNSIILTNEMLIIKFEEYNVRRKKEVIPIKDIIDIASADIKRRFVKKKMFAIRFKDAHEVKTLQLNHTVYFMKELQRLFDHLEKKYGITYIQF